MVAAANVILVIITFWYAFFTYSMLGEQRKGRQIAAIEKRLEKVYNPIEEAVFEFILKADQSNTITPLEIKKLFEVMDSSITKIKRNYGHLFDPDTTQSYQDISVMSLDLDEITDQSTVYDFRNSIVIFQRCITEKISKYKKQLEELQGIEQMNS